MKLTGAKIAAAVITPAIAVTIVVFVRSEDPKPRVDPLVAIRRAFHLFEPRTPPSFQTAKARLDRMYGLTVPDILIKRKTLYCSCDFKEDKKLSPKSCDKLQAKYKHTAIQWEHIVPASWFGKHRQCWSKGGRAECRKTDSTFRQMEADLVNLHPAIGTVNIRRSDLDFGEVSGEPREFGACDFEIDRKRRVVEVASRLLGLVARVRLYMHFAYPGQFAKPLTTKQLRALVMLSAKNPPTKEERDRDSVVRNFQGTGNPILGRMK